MDVLERMIGLLELEVILYIAEDFSAHDGVVEPSEEESFGRYIWGTRNTEGRR